MKRPARGLALAGDDDDRARGMGYDLRADRAHQQPREPSCAARAHDHQVSVPRGADQLLGRQAAGGLYRHQLGLRISQRADGPECRVLGSLADLLQFGLVGR